MNILLEHIYQIWNIQYNVMDGEVTILMTDDE